MKTADRVLITLLYNKHVHRSKFVVPRRFIQIQVGTSIMFTEESQTGRVETNNREMLEGIDLNSH